MVRDRLDGDSDHVVTYVAGGPMPTMDGMDDRAFERIHAEWRSLDACGRGEVAHWGSAIDAMAREERDLRHAGRWVRGRDDLFGILGVHRAEVRHSAMIAWLLDPCAKHGFGTRFLEAFLHAAFGPIDLPDLVNATPVCEVVRGECRADIVIWMADTTIVIEAKVDASESERQCAILCERFGADVAPRFIFLTPSGRPPETARDVFATLSFRRIGRILSEILTHDAPVTRGQQIAADYLRTLTREFGHEPR